MAELVDALDSKSCIRKDVQVRFLFWALLFFKILMVLKNNKKLKGRQICRPFLYSINKFNTSIKLFVPPQQKETKQKMIKPRICIKRRLIPFIKKRL